MDQPFVRNPGDNYALRYRTSLRDLWPLWAYVAAIVLLSVLSASYSGYLLLTGLGWIGAGHVSGQWPSALVAFAATLAIFGGLVLPLRRKHAGLLRATMGAERELVLDAAGLHWFTALGVPKSCPWTAMSNVLVRGRWVVVLGANGSTLFSLPRRVFGSDSIASAFCAEAQRNIDSTATSSTPAGPGTA